MHKGVHVVGGEREDGITDTKGEELGFGEEEEGQVRKCAGLGILFLLNHIWRI